MTYEARHGACGGLMTEGPEGVEAPLEDFQGVRFW